MFIGLVISFNWEEAETSYRSLSPCATFEKALADAKVEFERTKSAHEADPSESPERPTLYAAGPQ
jgi:hypothetical protein